MSEAVARVPGVAKSVTTPPIIGVGLSMETWARSCSGEESGAAVACGPMWALQCEFPTVSWALMAQPLADSLVIPERSWRAAPGDLYRWDRAMGALSQQPSWLVVQGDDESHTLGDTAREILTRYQRLVPRTNAASESPVFRKVLSGHRALHDLSLPLVRADYEHSLDVWQWVLRLAPCAGLAVQLAALFHDVERLVSEAERRVEHLVADYQSFKNAHAEAGAKLATRVLEGCSVDSATVAEVARLIHEHELRRPALGGDAGLLADADALSFFSLNSPGFADYYGAEHTQKKVRYSLARMSSGAVRRLAAVRLREDVRVHLVEAAQVEMQATLRQVAI
jgi:Domain of unknown function (DUF4202)